MWLRLSVRPVFKLAVYAVLPGLAGCNVRGMSTPPAEAVLEGTWRVVVPADPSLDEVLVFDSTGRIVERRRVVGATTIAEADVHRSTEVNGDSVRIEAKGDLGQSNVFEGTFNADKSIISGKLSNVVTFGSTTFSTEVGEATLTKQ